MTILGPKVRPAPKPAEDPAKNWRPIAGKPHMQRNGLGQMRYVPPPPPAAPGDPYQVPWPWPNYQTAWLHQSKQEGPFFAPGVHRVIRPFWS